MKWITLQLTILTNFSKIDEIFDEIDDLKMPLTTLFDDYIDRPKLYEQK